jgi:hypothetical protein
MSVLQRSGIRKKYNIQGSLVEDIVWSWCCSPCALVQAEKEVEIAEAEKAALVSKQYAATEQMQYGGDSKQYPAQPYPAQH